MSLVAKIEKLETSNRKASETIARLNQEMEAGQQPETNDETEVETEAMQPQGSVRIPQQGGSTLLILWDSLKTYWKIIAPLLLIIMLLSVLMTKVIIEARIKRRFHGIKIW